MFNSILNFIINDIFVSFIHGGFVIYNFNALIIKILVINPIPNYIIPLYVFQKNYCAINFTYDEMIPKFEVFTNNKLDKFYLTESIIT